MSKEVFTLKGKVIEALPNAMFKVSINEHHVVISTVSGKIRRFNINISVGDFVDVEMTPYDLLKGRISYRHK